MAIASATLMDDHRLQRVDEREWAGLMAQLTEFELGWVFKITAVFAVLVGEALEG